jgi:hypothetical protein
LLYQYRVRLVPDGHGTVELAKAQPVGGWELVSFKVTDLGDEVSVFRRPLAA